MPPRRRLSRTERRLVSTRVATRKGGDGAIVAMSIHGDDLVGMGDEMLDEMVPRAVNAVTAVRDRIHADIRHSISFILRRPAAPGDPPRTVTGALFRSARKGKVTVSSDKRLIQGTIRVGGKSAPGANRLEFGKLDKRGVKTFPHPFVRPAFARVQGFAQRLFARL